MILIIIAEKFLGHDHITPHLVRGVFDGSTLNVHEGNHMIHPYSMP